MTKLLLYTLVICLTYTTALGQQTGLFEWQDHLSYAKGFKVAVTNERAYCATDGGLFSVDKEERSIFRHSRVNGASDIGVQAIETLPNGEGVLVGYVNGNMDLIYDDRTVINLPDILNARISGDKTIYYIEAYQEYLYVCTGFGIVQVDYQNTEIKETFFVGNNREFIKIEHLLFHNDYCHLLTDSGRYKISFSDLINRLPNWERDPDLVDSLNVTQQFFIGNTPYLIVQAPGFQNDSVLVKTITGWEKTNRFYLNGATQEDFNSIQVYNDTLVICNSTSLEIIDTAGNPITRVFDYNSESGVSPTSAVVEGEFYYIADFNNGLVISRGTFDNEVYNPGGPGSSNAYSMYATQDALYVSRGGLAGQTRSRLLLGGVYKFSGQEWTSYDATNISAFDTILDVLQLAPDPNNENKLYLASFYNGVAVLNTDNEKVGTVFNSTNSSLQNGNLTGLPQVSHVEFDENQNLWCTNSLSNKQLHVLSDGSWYGYSFPSVSAEAIPSAMKVINDHRVAVGFIDKGLLIFDHGGTLADTTDDNYISIASGDEGLPSNDVNDMIIDQDGELWIATTQGVRVIYNPEESNLAEINTNEVLINQDGQTKILLEDQFVSCIATNPSNQKWFGTLSGSFLMSAEGTQEIHAFDITNSPMLSDRIISLAVLPSTGEVFFGTDRGIISYRDESTTPWSNMSQVTAFPNPVPVNYQGTIGIKGLTEESNIKITDTQGRLVYETESVGGQATWNGTSLDGQYVAPGVYRIYCTQQNGTETGATSILILGFD